MPADQTPPVSRELLTREAIDDALRDVSRYYSGDHVNANGVVGRIQRALAELPAAPSPPVGELDDEALSRAAMIAAREMWPGEEIAGPSLEAVAECLKLGLAELAGIEGPCERPASASIPSPESDDLQGGSVGERGDGDELADSSLPRPRDPIRGGESRTTTNREGDGDAREALLNEAFGAASLAARGYWKLDSREHRLFEDVLRDRWKILSARLAPAPPVQEGPAAFPLLLDADLTEAPIDFERSVKAYGRVQETPARISELADRGGLDAGPLLARVYMYAAKGEAPSRGLLADIEAYFAASSLPVQEGEGRDAPAREEWRVLGIDVDDAGDEVPSPEVLIDPTFDGLHAAELARDANRQEVEQGNPPYYRVVLQRRERTVTEWVDVPATEDGGDGHG